MDATGRPVSVTNAAGATNTTGWSVADLPLWTRDPAGRVSVTDYDTAGRPTDTWGPWSSECFADAARPDGTHKVSVDTPACQPAMPHTHTGYDEGMAGLAATWWPNLTLTGSPAAHSTATPTTWGTGSPHPALSSAQGYAARFTGALTVPAGSYTFAADVGANGDDGVRVYVDEQVALQRWDSMAQAVTADQPSGYWRLGEGSGSVAVDSSPGAHAGTYDGVQLGQAGGLGADPDTSAAFPNAASVTVPQTVGTDTFTVEAWVKPTAPIAIQDPDDDGAAGTAGQRWLFYPSQSGGNAGAGVSVGTNGIGVYEHGDGYLPPRASYQADLSSGWHHVAVVYSARSATVYLDGQPVASSATSPRPTVIAPTQIGYGNYGDYEGGVDEVAVYGRALDAGRVNAHYRAGRPSFTSAAQATGPASNGVFDLSNGQPHRLRVDYKNPTGPGNLTLTATNAATGAVISLAGDRLTPQYGLATTTVTDDSGDPTPSMTTSTSYADAATGIDPALGLATPRRRIRAGSG
ncbi:MAG: LamG-like jellyroll fold domain-containing protein [Dermatophilaceae bacterium]